MTKAICAAFKAAGFAVLVLLAVCAKAALSLDSWTYIAVDQNRTGNSFGMALGDITGDGYVDIVAGKYFYRNPGGNLTGVWQRTQFPIDVDAMFVVDVDGDGKLDIVGLMCNDLYWLKPSNAAATQWTSTKVATIDGGCNEGLSSQGYAHTRLVPGPKEQLLIYSDAGNMICVTIPDNPQNGNWPKSTLVSGFAGEGIAIADIDGDGKPDVAGAGANRTICWWKNPGSLTATWMKHDVGTINADWDDRMGAADFNGDGRTDLITTEELLGSDQASVYWYEQPAAANGVWTRHLLVQQYSALSMDVADMNVDGKPDIVTGEAEGPDKVQVWENSGAGTFTPHLVSQGHQTHIGCLTADFDKDGDLDIASTSWTQANMLFLWRNDAVHTTGLRNSARPSPQSSGYTMRFVGNTIRVAAGSNRKYRVDVFSTCGKIRYSAEGHGPQTLRSSRANPGVMHFVKLRFE
jgi:hypothetical protein